MLKHVAFAVIGAAALVAAPSSAHAGRGGCDEWGCGTNGTSFNGLSRNGLQLEGVAVEQAAPDQVVSVIVLPSGEIVSVGDEEAPIGLGRKALPSPKPKPN